MSSAPHIALYTSDHGYGHAMRAVFLAEALIERGCHAHLVCDRPGFLFARLPPASFTLHPRQLDAGLAQRDWLTIDAEATLYRHRRLSADPEALIQRELGFLREINASLVVADAPPIALEIARRASLPGILSTNFDWHWLYRELSLQHPGFAPLAQQAKEWYQSTSLVLRLPFHAGMEQTFSSFTDIPLLVGRLRRTREEIRRDLGLPLDAPALLWNFGGHQGTLPDFDRLLSALPEWHLLTYAEHPTLNPRFHHVPSTFNSTELFSVLDGLIGKLGYCTCAEAYAFQVPFLFFARHHYPEDLALQAHCENSMNAARLHLRDLQDGAWLDTFQAITTAPRKELPPSDGAEQAARHCLKLLAAPRSLP
jgi:L-arabinokinase